jgi:hypothetical protein
MKHNCNSLLLSAADRKFQILKPWTTCLAENKKIWKEQAIKGKL